MQAFLLEFVQKFAFKKKEGKGGGYVSFSALPLTILPFFCSCFNFLNELALKKLATQAANHPYLSWVVGMGGEGTSLGTYLSRYYLFLSSPFPRSVTKKIPVCNRPPLVFICHGSWGWVRRVPQGTSLRTYLSRSSHPHLPGLCQR